MRSIIRIILTIITIISVLAILSGISLAITKNYSGITGLIIGVIAIIIVHYIKKKLNNAEDEEIRKDRQSVNRKCNKCGCSLRGAAYSYHEHLKVHKSLGERYVQVAVDLTCPHCGKNMIKVETIYVHDGEPIEDIKRDIDNQLEDYYGILYD